MVCDWMMPCLAFFFPLLPVLVVATLVSSTVQLFFFLFLTQPFIIYLFLSFFLFFFDTLGNGKT
jgi:hypothetical protein